MRSRALSDDVRPAGISVTARPWASQTSSFAPSWSLSTRHLGASYPVSSRPRSACQRVPYCAQYYCALQTCVSTSSVSALCTTLASAWRLARSRLTRCFSHVVSPRQGSVSYAALRAPEPHSRTRRPGLLPSFRSSLCLTAPCVRSHTRPWPASRVRHLERLRPASVFRAVYRERCLAGSV